MACRLQVRNNSVAASLYADRRDQPAGPMRRLHWTRDQAAEATSPESDVIYRFTRPDGAVVSKQWILPAGEGRYDLRLRLAVTSPTPAAGGAKCSNLHIVTTKYNHS